MVLKNLIEASQDEADRLTAISREKFLLDAESDRLTAYENGIQTSYKQIVQNMRTEGVSDEQIALLTRIPIEDVKKI